MAFDRKALGQILQLAIITVLSFLVAKNFIDTQELRAELELLKSMVNVLSLKKKVEDDFIIPRDTDDVVVSEDIDDMFNRYSFTLGNSLPPIEELEEPTMEESAIEEISENNESSKEDTHSIPEIIISEPETPKKKKSTVRKRKVKSQKE